MPRRVLVRRVGVWPVVQLGAMSGAVVALPPGLACGILLRLAAGVLRKVLEGWTAVRLPSPVPAVSSPPVSFVALLHLQEALDTLRSWDTPWVPLLVTLAAGLAGAAGGAVAGLLAAWLVNLGAAAGRGLSVDVEDPT